MLASKEAAIMVTRLIARFSIVLLVLAANHAVIAAEQDGWISLFDGKTFDGWKANENRETFKVEDGAIVANGARSHLFYTGPIENATFTDFELKMDVMTKPNSNSGIYFHTVYQETGWPAKGFEVQVNNSYKADPRKTGSLWGIVDVTKAGAEDNVWFTEHIIVRGKRVVIKVEGKTVVDWAEPDPPKPPTDSPGKILGSGTFALQGHDPGSTVYYKNIKVKPLPVIDFPLTNYHVHLKGGLTIDEAIAKSEKTGIKYGIAQNCGVGFPVTNDAGLRRFLDSMEGKPVYKAMQAEGREWVTMFSPAMIAKADYVFTDSMTWTDDKGRRMRLWMANEVFVDDEQDFMDMLVRRIEGVMAEPVDIYVNPTFLPARIADKYDQLWTEQRMDKVIAAAVKNGIAIEINARYKLPSKKFILKAKKAGLKFACGTNNGGRDVGDIEYCKRMIRECKLGKTDFFVPKPDGRKPIQVKK